MGAGGLRRSERAQLREIAQGRGQLLGLAWVQVILGSVTDQDWAGDPLRDALQRVRASADEEVICMA